MTIGKEAIVWFPEGQASSSASSIQQTLNANSISTQMVSELPSIIGNTDYIFICLGVFPNNAVLENGDDIDRLTAYLNSGGRLYMEGGDTWARDYPTKLHAYFHVFGEADGRGDLSTIRGHACFSAFTFAYGGAQQYIDHLAPMQGAVLFFSNEQPGYGAGVGYDNGAYRTLAVSFEFGGLVDGDAGKNDVMGEILAYFDNGCAGGGPAPFTVQAISGYDQAVPLLWEAPVGQVTLSANDMDAPTMMFSSRALNESGVNRKAQDRGMSVTPGLAKTNRYQTHSYNVYRSTTSGGPFQKIAANIKRQYYRDTPVTNAATYYYVITSNYDSGESDFSEESAATPQAAGHILTSNWTSDYLNVDGIISTSEWNNATIIDVRQSGQAEPVYLYLLNNQEYLYIAIDDVANQTLNIDDQVGVYIDRDFDYEWSDDEPLEGNFWFLWDGTTTIDFYRLLDGWWPEQIEWENPVNSDLAVTAFSTSNGHVQHEIRLALQEIELLPDMTFPLNTFIYSLDMPDSVYRAAWPASVLSSLWSTAWLAPVLYGTIQVSGEPECPFFAESENVTSGLYSFHENGDGHQVDIIVKAVNGSGDITVTKYDCPYADLPGADPLTMYWHIDRDETLVDMQSDYVFYYTDEDARDFTETGDYFGMAWFDETANSWKWKGGEVDADKNSITVQNITETGVFVLYRRLFGDSTGDGYVGAADLQQFGDVWLEQSEGEFPAGAMARFFNYNKNARDGVQLIDAGDLQVFGDCWLNGTAP